MFNQRRGDRVDVVMHHFVKFLNDEASPIKRPGTIGRLFLPSVIIHKCQSRKTKVRTIGTPNTGLMRLSQSMRVKNWAIKRLSNDFVSIAVENTGFKTESRLPICRMTIKE